MLIAWNVYVCWSFRWLKLACVFNSRAAVALIFLCCIIFLSLCRLVAVVAVGLTFSKYCCQKIKQIVRPVRALLVATTATTLRPIKLSCASGRRFFHVYCYIPFQFICSLTHRKLDAKITRAAQFQRPSTVYVARAKLIRQTENTRSWLSKDSAVWILLCLLMRLIKWTATSA